ncbi:sulfate/molybdate ABC transporter ATP-binding protein [Cryobacterium sp. PAMC25264]|uniref:sulfate/molybdate ABC transporter ATP-binding protein n=1 Tax=Cryobacterium sp. PAMC25264 TaxID=2861288 RepID=UPI001C6275BF|nr:ABC transporter ATP-binding protein [Cryobacterium sp. PAMC25264]QYF73051.1 ABC transporter ATP-binding protein [Cryobacterium sp. PAMC25264]
MSFSVDVHVAERDVRLHLTVAAGETVAVLGPNGAGKSTLLGAIAGLIRPDSGRSELNGTVLFDLPAGPGRGIWRPAHQRGVSLLAQEPLLFPHLSVLDNVAFGPRSIGATTAGARARAARWLGEVDAEPLAARRPAELSGGQAQRIAVARALASDPGLLLLDEPLAALDVSVAPAVRRMLRRVLVDRSSIIVTHDVLDAYTLADRVVIVENGRIVDEGTPAEVFDRPRSAFAAGLAGLNLITGVRRGDTMVTADTATTVENIPEPTVAEGAPLSLAVRPAAVSVVIEPPADPQFSSVRAELIDLEPRGDLVRARSAVLAADVSPQEAAQLDAAVGSMVWFAFPADSATVYPTVPPDRPTPL